MGKLTIEQVKFIDTYLLNSGVKYVDIRYEMTDHIATALEKEGGDFYENFKQYMLQHKKELLKSNYQFSKAAGKRALKMILKNMVTPLTLIVFAAFFGMSHILYDYLGKENLVEVYFSGYLLLGLCIILCYKYYYGVSRHKYSVVDKLQALFPVSLYIIFVLIKPDRIIDNSFILVAYYSFFTAFMMSNIITFRALVKKYKLRYR